MALVTKEIRRHLARSRRAARYRKTHREKLAEYHRNLRKKHAHPSTPEELADKRKRQARYKAKHPERVRKRARKYWKKKNPSGPGIGRWRKPKALINDAGRKFKSAATAAKAYQVGTAAIYFAAKDPNRICATHRWTYAESGIPKEWDQPADLKNYNKKKRFMSDVLEDVEASVRRAGVILESGVREGWLAENTELSKTNFPNGGLPALKEEVMKAFRRIQLSQIAKTKNLHDGTFEQRRLTDPQGCIDDLLGQTARQGADIARYLALLEGNLEPADAVFLLKLLASQPVTVSRDYYAEEVTERLTKKFTLLANPPKPAKEKKPKKKKEVTNATNEMFGSQ